MFETKSSKRLISIVAILLFFIGLWYFWPSGLTSDFKRSNRELGKATGKHGMISSQSKPPSLRDISDRWPFSHRTNLSRDKASLEFCLIDAKTEYAIQDGSVSVLKEPTESIIFSNSVDYNGCIGVELDPGPYSISFQAPGYANKTITLEISSSHDHARRIIELYRTLTIKGIVLNAFHQPQPDATVLFGVLYSSSIIPLRAPVHTSNSGEFTAELQRSKVETEKTMIFASKSSYGIAQLGPLNIHEIGNKYLEIVLLKGENYATISGRVFDSEMKPVRGATVEFIPLPRIATINPNLRGLDAETLQTIMRNDPARAFIKQPEPTYSDPLLSSVSRNYLRPKTESNEVGYFSLQIQIPNTGALKASADGHFPFQGNRFNISGSISEDIHLRIPQIFSVQVRNFDGEIVLGTTARGTDNYLFRLDSQSKQYFSTEYPFTIFAEGIRYNQGITERKQILRYQKDIELALGNCNVQGQVIDENELPIKYISVTVNTVGETEQKNGFKIGQSANYYSENGVFSLRHLIPGKASLTIIGSSNEHTIFEKKNIELLLLEGSTVNPIIVLNRK